MVDSVAYMKAAGARLRKLRLAVSPQESIEVFAERTGAKEDRLSAWERGLALVRPWYVTKLKQMYGVTQDWIYDGQEIGLSAILVDKLNKAPDAEDAPPLEQQPRRRSGGRRR